MAAIPASELVAVQPGVIGAGGSPLSLNTVILTSGTTTPIDTLMSFATHDDVADYYGASSEEARIAAIVFGGFTGATSLPGLVYFSQFATASVAAYSRGANAGLTLAEIQALIPAVTTSSIAATTMTVASVASGTVVPGMLLTGTGVTAGTRVVAQLTGAVGSIGTYSVTESQTTTSTTITGNYDMSLSIDGVVVDFVTLNLSAAASYSAAATALGTALGLSGGQTCTYDSNFGAFVITSGTTGAASSITIATGLGASVFELDASATLSQGSAAMVPADAMDTITEQSLNWASFMTLFEPDTDDKTLFAEWVQGQNKRFLYVAWDTDDDAIVAGNDTCFGALVLAAEYDGVVVVYNDIDHAALVCAITGAINFAQVDGRITYAFKWQSGLTASVTNATIAQTLIANGYNFGGQYATANDTFTGLQPGQIAGVWEWIDSYVNQIKLNSELQLSGMTLLSNVNSLPYNNDGYTTVRQAFLSPIQDALSFGSIRIGVALSATQAAQVNLAAGVPIDKVLEQFGYYLQVLPATAQARANRTSPPANLWYMDGGSIQKLNLGSTAVI